MKAYNNHILSCDAHGVVKLHAESKADSHFHLRDHPQEPKIAIKDAHNNYLTVDNHEHIKSGRAPDDEPTAHQWFHYTNASGAHQHAHPHHANN